MNLENSIKDVISKKLEDGTVENLVSEQLEKGVTNALDNLFRSYGDVTKVIEDKVKSVMVPYLEDYDYSDYIVKLDAVLVEVLKSTALENRRLLENFKELTCSGAPKKIKVSELFEKWMSYVEKNVKTDDLDIGYDEEPTYEYVEVAMDFDESEERSWSSFDHGVIVFECEHDEEMNVAIPVSRWRKHDKDWSIEYKTTKDLDSLRNLNEFEVFIMKLKQSHSDIVMDTKYETSEIIPEERPEASFY